MRTVIHPWSRRVAVIVAGLLATTLDTPAAAVRPDAESAPPIVEPSKPREVKSVNGRTMPPISLPTTAPAEQPKAAVAWPGNGAAEVTLPEPSGGSARSALATDAQAGTLPVRVGRIDGRSPAKVRVRFTDGAISVRRTDGAAAPGPMRLTVDYSGFRDTYGGDWASRLRLVSRDGLPASGVRNDVRSATLSADVQVEGADQTFGIAAAPEGSAGDYKATSLSPTGKWQVSAHSGAFAWGYELRMPPVPGGLEPELSPSYNSNAVDGRTASTNSQPSWLGEGWALWPGFIERSYKGCAGDLGGNNGTTKTGDLCWETDNATMSFGSHSGQLVLQDGVWRPKDDDGTKVERLTNTSNGDNDNEYWKLTTTDGTQYFFGRRADSAWTVPVFGNDVNEPCKKDTFDASQCDQAYRWNLDYVVDRHGNSMSYFYREENNLYGANLGRRGASYTRGGTLERIEYGTRDGAAGQAPVRVWFDVGDRCLSNCATHNATTWPDVPWDRECTSGTCADKVSPTFWSTKRLTKITMQISTGGGNYRNVEQWVFTHSFPPVDGGTTPALWLTGIIHSGLAGPATEPSVTLPAVTFGGFQFPNRIDTVNDGLPALQKYRITSIKNESGGDINVSYRTECAPGATPPANANTKLCFPVHWAAPLDTEPRSEFFHKYAVTKISEADDIGGNVTQITNYDYDPAGAAWAFDDNPLTEQAKRTWSEWRGYEKVVVRKGQEANKPESWTQHQFFRGMNRDIVDSRGTAIADPEQYAGFERETIVKDRGTEVTGEIHTPWSRLTATDAYQASLKAHQVENGKTESRTRLSDGTYRNTRVETEYDNHGNPVKVNDAGDLASTTDNWCTTTIYAKNLATMVVNLPSEVKTIGVACGGTPSFPGDAITDTRTYYDDRDLGAAPSKGDVTKTEVAKDYTGSVPAYLNDKRTVPDAYGRVVESYDALGRKTTTSYVEENGLTKTVTETNPKIHVKTTTLDPAWGQPIKIVDANNRATSLAYDALGRLTGVWKPGRNKDAQLSPHLRYTYEVRNNATSWVKTEKLNANENHVASLTLLDGFLRPRQTQAPSPQGGRIITDTLYDSRGQVNVTRAPYYNTDAAPGTSLFLPNAGEVPNATVKVYDGAERESDSIYLKLNVEQWRTRTYHGGDRVSVVPPAGGTATTTITDARGKTTALLQYKSRPASGPPTGATDQTNYGYTKRGELATLTDPARNVWRNTYDVLGRKKTADDPDKGATTMTYDNAGQLLTATDARGKKITAVYDALGRKTESWLDAPVTGTLLTKSVYDTPEKGALKSSTRYADGKAYTRTADDWDDAGRPRVATVSIPYVEAEKELAGTYTTSTTYAWDDSPLATTLPPLGNLPSETINHGYGSLGLPNTLEGTQKYVTKTIYTALGEPAQTEYGVDGKRVWRTSYYEEGTRRPERLLTEREQVNGIMVHELTYDYDPIGNVTRIGDRTAGQAPDTQCFRYDYLRRATEAWTATDDCAGGPSVPVVGGPAPYWHQFGYDLIGNRKTQTKKGLNGSADTVSTYTYPASGDGVDRPHGVTSIQTGATTGAYSYDNAGNTTGRRGPSGQQTLSWTDEGLLESVNSAAQSTRYVYDADGTQLLRRDNDSVTLFVGGGEVKLNTTTRTKTGTRYYNGMGARTASGLVWTVADHHGTAQVAIDSNSLAATPRRLDLFGNPRANGSPAFAAAWPGGDRGFVGGIPNEATGLTRLGAREYDPATGKFLSVDPLMDPNDPQQINAYSYSNNNPATLSDPSGLFYDCGCASDRYGSDNVLHNHNGSLLSASNAAKWLTAKQLRRWQKKVAWRQHLDRQRADHDRAERERLARNRNRAVTVADHIDQHLGNALANVGVDVDAETLARLMDDAEKEAKAGGHVWSVSICANAGAGFVYGQVARSCVSVDEVGITFNYMKKEGLLVGAEGKLSALIRLSSESAKEINSHTGGLRVSVGGQAGLGPYGGVEIEAPYPITPEGHAALTLQAGVGVGANVGSFMRITDAGNTGYIYRW